MTTAFSVGDVLLIPLRVKEIHAFGDETNYLLEYEGKGDTTHTIKNGLRIEEDDLKKENRGVNHG